MTKHNIRVSKGATLIELIVVMAIVGVFARLVTFDLFRGQQRSSITIAKDGVVRDMRAEQLRAMSGDTATPNTYTDYSIQFTTNQYILFPGSVYSSNNPNNTVIQLDPILQFSSVLFPGSMVTFARISGDVRSYVVGADSVTLTNIQTGDHFTMQLNAHGVTSVH